MSTQKLEQTVTDLMLRELRRANAEHMPFSSAGEGYATVMMKVEEATERLEWVENELQEMWLHVRKNSPDYYGDAERMKQFALGLACEAIQVAAMCEKFLALGGQQD